jgi:hypothetical protein
MTAPDGSNVDISQNVTWTAKFVDKMSEVTDSLNVSGMAKFVLVRLRQCLIIALRFFANQTRGRQSRCEGVCVLP